MPASKRALRGGGDLPRNPAHLRKRPSKAAESPQGPSQLELVPEPQAVPDVASLDVTAGHTGIVITIKASTLKESNGKFRKGKPPAYRSVTGEDAGGKRYWMAIELDQADPKKGELWVVQGTEKKPFGDEGKTPLHPIHDITSFAPYEETVAAIENSSQVSSAAPDELVQTMKALLKQYNLCGVLQALTDALKE